MGADLYSESNSQMGKAYSVLKRLVSEINLIVERKCLNGIPNNDELTIFGLIEEAKKEMPPLHKF